MVDGAPFLMLGAQCHNSSAWPDMLPKVWAAIDDLHANTLEIPIYWEQFEPEQGKFDPSIVDLIIKGAREHNVRLVLLWFGTWKNGSRPLHARSGPKARPELFTHITGNRGRSVDSPSPLAEACMQADMKAFSALMRHLKSVDPVHTVIMIQVENEPGAWRHHPRLFPGGGKGVCRAGAGGVLEGAGRQKRGQQRQRQLAGGFRRQRR